MPEPAFRLIRWTPAREGDRVGWCDVALGVLEIRTIELRYRNGRPHAHMPETFRIAADGRKERTGSGALRWHSAILIRGAGKHDAFSSALWQLVQAEHGPLLDA